MERLLAALVVLCDVRAICKLESATDPSCKMTYPQYRVDLKVNLPSSLGYNLKHWLLCKWGDGLEQGYGKVSTVATVHFYITKHSALTTRG